MNYYGPAMGGWGFLMTLTFVLFLALVALGVVAVLLGVRRSHGRTFSSHIGPMQGPFGAPGPYGAPGPSGPGAWAGSGLAPEQILADRFARGEIDEKEYRQRMAALRAEGEAAGPAPADPS